MTNIVEARSLFKSYGGFVALDNIDLCIPQGAISGLIGPNGAGKTTALKSLIGLCDVEGDINVAGRDPRVARHKLMEDVCFIADVGILPKWLRCHKFLNTLRQFTLNSIAVKLKGFSVRLRSLATKELKTCQRGW